MGEELLQGPFSDPDDEWEYIDLRTVLLACHLHPCFHPCSFLTPLQAVDAYIRSSRIWRVVRASSQDCTLVPGCYGCIVRGWLLCRRALSTSVQTQPQRQVLPSAPIDTVKFIVHAVLDPGRTTSVTVSWVILLLPGFPGRLILRRFLAETVIRNFR